VAKIRSENEVEVKMMSSSFVLLRMNQSLFVGKGHLKLSVLFMNGKFMKTEKDVT
jgi:hypothetical protein